MKNQQIHKRSNKYKLNARFIERIANDIIGNLWYHQKQLEAFKKFTNTGLI